MRPFRLTLDEHTTGAWRRIARTCIGAACAWVAACAARPEAVANGDDPLAALRVSVSSTRYTSDYWVAQVHADSQRLWTQALAYCGGAQPRPGLELDGAKPNCAPVRYALFRLNNERAANAARDQQAAEAARQQSLTPAQRAAERNAQLNKMLGPLGGPGGH